MIIMTIITVKRNALEQCLQKSRLLDNTLDKESHSSISELLYNFGILIRKL